jgi:hypothetical protein
MPIRLMMTWITSNASFEANVMTASLAADNAIPHSRPAQ